MTNGRNHVRKRSGKSMAITVEEKSPKSSSTCPVAATRVPRFRTLSGQRSAQIRADAVIAMLTLLGQSIVQAPGIPENGLQGILEFGEYVETLWAPYHRLLERRDDFGAFANGAGDKHDAAARSLLVATSAVSRVHEQSATSQFRWEPQEREPSRGRKDDQQTEDERLSEAWVKVMPPISSGPQSV